MASPETPPLVITPDLSITPEFRLPDDADARRLSVLGMSGSGKTSVAKVIVEHLHAASRRIAIVDPKGIWWGLRTGADGTSPGLPFVVFGGRHADVPLEVSAGAAVADLVMDENVPVILDLSGFEDEADYCRVAADFIRRLRSQQHPGLEPLLLVVDEADLICPQNALKVEVDSQRQLRGVARRSRSDGLGLLTITQRPATLHKDVLGQAEALILCRFMGYNDLDAVKDTLGSFLSPAERDEAVRALPTLSDGECFVASPSWMHCFQRVQFPLPQTFDSSATPRAGQRRAVTGSALIDVSALAARFSAAIEREQENDPEHLRGRLREQEVQIREQEVQLASLERQISEKPVVVPAVVEKRVEVPVLSEAQARDLQERAEAFVGVAKSLMDLAAPLVVAANEILAELRGHKGASAMPPVGIAAPHEPSMRDAILPPPAMPRKAAQPSSETGEKMPLAERKILTVLAQYPAGRTKTQVAILAGYAIGGGGFGNALSALKTKGWREGENACLRATEAGLTALGTWEPLPTGQALAEHWYKQLGKAERCVLQILVDVHPRALTKADLAQRAGYEASGGSFGNALSRLRTLELIEGRAEMKAADALFNE